MGLLKSLMVLMSLLISVSYADDLPKEYRFKGNHYSISFKLEDDLQTIRLHGEIYSTIIEDMTGFERVLNLIRKDVPVKFVLVSGGGYLKSMERLPRKLKENCNSAESSCRIRTIVPTYAICSSACVHMFMVGDERIAGKATRFGFHQGAALPGVMKLPGLAQKTLRKVGVDKDWLENNEDLFSSTKMSYLYPRQMEGSNIITGFSEAYEY